MRYSFAVCKDCGVQSPPMIELDSAKEILVKQGWKIDTLKFSIIATCPKCNEEAKTK